MKRKVLKLVKCPFCNSPLKITEVFEKSGEILTGILKCDCREYPIIEGIPIIKKTPEAQMLLKLVKNGCQKDALGFLLSGYLGKIFLQIHSWESISFIIKFAKKICEFLSKFIINRTLKKYKMSKSFFELASKIYPETSADYQKYRFSAQSFWVLYPFVSILKGERILDIGSGMGYSAFILSPFVKDIVCLDPDFKSLFVSKKYFSKNAHHFCIDANLPLPFKSNSFSSVLMLDSFHYIDGKALLAKETQRVTDSKGSILVLHLHNSRVSDPAPGVPLTYHQYIDLFDNIEVKVFPEEELLNMSLMDNELDLTKNFHDSVLNKSILAIVASKNKDVFKCYRNIGKNITKMKKNLIINPVFKMKKDDDYVVLTRKFPSNYFKKEYPFSERYLPKRIRLSKEFSDLINDRGEVKFKQKNSKEIKNLMRKLIIINVPKKYV